MRQNSRGQGACCESHLMITHKTTTRHTPNTTMVRYAHSPTRTLPAMLQAFWILCRYSTGDVAHACYDCMLIHAHASGELATERASLPSPGVDMLLRCKKTGRVTGATTGFSSSGSIQRDSSRLTTRRRPSESRPRCG
eukprot:7382541-Prymnesium_polylepis.1